MNEAERPTTSNIELGVATERQKTTDSNSVAPSTPLESKKSPQKQQNGRPVRRKFEKNRPKIKMQKPNQDDPSVEAFKQMQQDVRLGLQSCEPGKELEVLHHTLRPDHQTLWLKCMDVKRDIWTALKRYYPSVRLEVFGSTVMGIAFKDSDFDFYIELSREQSRSNAAKIIGKVMSILARSELFTNFLPISQARVPILKCYHIRTGYQCDLNFSDSFGILNSPIVAHLLKFDPRIYVLATIIKYWMKVHDCAGKNRISNYGVMWLLLFYLQTLPQPIVPPIIEFQRHVRPFIVNHCNFAFDYQMPNRSRNQSRCSDLLLGFFQYYRDFDFGSHLICPLHAKIFRKAEVLEKKIPELQRYEEILLADSYETPMQLNKSICIQDPFDITHTIPGVIANLEFQKIVWKIGYAAEVIQEELKKSGETTALILQIFDSEKFDQFVKTKKVLTKTSARQQSKAVTSVVTQDAQNSKTTYQIKSSDFMLSIVRELLSKSSKGAAGKFDKHAIQQFWAETVIEIVVHIFKDIFMVEINAPKATETSSTSMPTENGEESPPPTTTDEPDAPETPTSEEAPKEDDNATKVLDKKTDKFLKIFDINGTCDVFLGRKQTKKVTANTLNIELRDSQHRFKNANAAKCKINLNASVKITTDLENFDAVTVELSDQIKTKKNNFYKTFCTNFIQNVNNLLKIYFVYKSQTKKPDVNGPQQPQQPQQQQSNEIASPTPAQQASS